jgi:hypothetical protein
MVALVGSATLDSAQLDSKFIITVFCIVRFWISETINVAMDARKVYRSSFSHP